MTVIDVHTHMLSETWLARLQELAAPRYSLREVRSGLRMVHMDGAPFMTLTTAMFDYEQRIRDMDAAGVDIAVISLTCPNVFWGTPEQSAETARLMNDTFAEAQAKYPNRIRWLANLPWQYPDAALSELERALAMGAAGVMCLGNVVGEALTDDKFAPIWQEIDRQGLGVLLHPTVPPGHEAMALDTFNLVPMIGFMFDTSLAVARMVLSGFFDRYSNFNLVAGHAGGTLPYLAGRMDFCYQNMPAVRENISQTPSAYLARICYDTVTFTMDALNTCINVGGTANVLYGSDYPHNIGDMAGCLARVDALAPEVAQAVRGDNARRVFRI